jgi:ketosteroid isomerase-like protein
MAVTEAEVRAIFAHLESGAGDAFFAHVADDVDWTVEGTHPLAGRYRSKAAFHAATFARLNRILPGGTQLHVTHAIVAGEEAVVELRSHAVSPDGKPFDNHYCWVLRFAGGMIVAVRAYLDSALVADLIGRYPNA